MFFCRYCGQKIQDDSIFCSFCGKKLATDEAKSNVIADTRVDINAETSNVDSNKVSGNILSVEPVVTQSEPEFVWDSPEFVWDPQALDEDKKTTEANLETKEEIQEPEVVVEKTEEPVVETLETLEEVTIEDIDEDIRIAEIEAEAGQKTGSKIDKFYTFNKKNEEFQKLLDKEYERVRNKEQELEDVYEEGELSLQDEIEEVQTLSESLSVAEEIKKVQEESSQEDVQAIKTPLVEEDNILDNEALSKKFDTKEFNADLIAFALERAGISIPRESIEAKLSRDTYESDFKPRFIEDSEDEQDSLQREIIEEIFQGQEHDDEVERITADGLPEIDPQKQEAFRELEKMWDSKASSEKDGDNEFKIAPELELKKDPEEKKVDKDNKDDNDTDIEASEDKDTSDAKVDDKVDNTGNADNAGNAENTEKPKSTSQKSYLADGEEGEGKKGTVLKVLIVFLAIIIALNLVVLGIVHLAPDSIAAEFINTTINDVVTWITTSEVPVEIGNSDTNIQEIRSS